MSQSKEQREAGEPKVYLGNGKVVYTEGTVKVAEREDMDVTAAVAETSDALPF